MLNRKKVIDWYERGWTPFRRYFTKVKSGTLVKRIFFAKVHRFMKYEGTKESVRHCISQSIQMFRLSHSSCHTSYSYFRSITMSLKYLHTISLYPVHGGIHRAEYFLIIFAKTSTELHILNGKTCESVHYKPRRLFY